MMFASNFNFQQKHSTNEPYSNVCRQPLTKNLNPIEHHLLDEEDFSDSYPDQECSHQNEIEGKPSYDVKESKDATLNEHQYEPLVVSRKESCGCKEPAKNADHESSFIRVEDHVVCQDNFIAGNLCHAVNIACKPFTRRAAMQVPRKKFTEFLGTTGKALSVLQANPHPNVHPLLSAIEPTNDTDGVLLFPSLHIDLSNWPTIKIPLQKKFEIAVAAFEAIAHCHKHNVVLLDIEKQSFCWTDEACTKLVLAGLGTARYVGQESSKATKPEKLIRRLAFSKDCKALGITLLRILGSRSVHAPPVKLPQTIRKILRILISSSQDNLPDVASLVTEFKSVLDQPVSPPVVAIQAPANVIEAQDEQVVPDVVRTCRKRKSCMPLESSKRKM
eukprot:m.333013 g.333013  ORF g.333013 m.333013 type:complete len:388 (+) comp17045_c0_seq1:192-1355(+)